MLNWLLSIIKRVLSQSWRWLVIMTSLLVELVSRVHGWFIFEMTSPCKNGDSNSLLPDLSHSIYQFHQTINNMVCHTHLSKWSLVNVCVLCKCVCVCGSMFALPKHSLKSLKMTVLFFENYYILRCLWIFLELNLVGSSTFVEFYFTNTLMQIESNNMGLTMNKFAACRERLKSLNN